MTDVHDVFAAASKTLEESFFAKENAKLIKALKQKEETEEQANHLSKISGIENQDILHKLVELKITPEILAALRLFPMIWVAWADGDVDTKEREAILQAAHQLIASEDKTLNKILENWLEEKPTQSLYTAWAAYTKGLKETMDPGTFAEIGKSLMDNARSVAESAGGFLGIGNKVSPTEEEALAELSKQFQL